MTTFLLRRIFLAAMQLLMVVTLVFFLLPLLPGDPVLIILGSEGSTDPVAVEAVRQRLGLDEPLGTRYLSWLGNLVKLDLGRSLTDGTPIWDEIAARLPRTLELVGLAVGLGLLVGIPFGIVAALNRGKVADGILVGLSTLGISVPVYVTGSLAILLFALTLGWLPTSGFRPIGTDPVGHLLRLIMPALTLAVSPIAIVTRMMRSSLLEVLRADYVRTARAKGQAYLRVLLLHAVRTALTPIVTVVGLQIGTLIGGSVLVEYVFNWPGISSLLIGAIYRRDYGVVQGVIVVSASLFILINLLVDVAYGMLDPRVRNA